MGGESGGGECEKIIDKLKLMFNSPVLDLVILLSFTYFIGSLILSAINEAIAGTLRLRQKDLGKALENLFFDPKWKMFVKNTLLKSPQLQSLMKRQDRMPAYIPASNFVLALEENLDQDEYAKGVFKPKVVNIPTNQNLLPDVILTVMQTIWNQSDTTEAKSRKEEFETKLEEFYNNAMNRTTGWYKRRIRRILLVVGLILAFVLNIDTIEIVNNALKDKTQLSKTVDNITANLPKSGALNQTVTVKDTSGNVVINTSIAATTDSIKKLQIIYENTTGYSLGYNDFHKQWKGHFWIKLLGLLITAFALQMGSNYWFDLMNKAVNIRAAGKKPVEKDSTKK